MKALSVASEATGAGFMATKARMNGKKPTADDLVKELDATEQTFTF